MDTAIVIAVTFIVAFWIGFAFARVHKTRRGAFYLRTFVTVIAVVASISALLGFIAFAAPTVFMNMLGNLPEGIKEMVVMDILLRGGSGLLAFVVVAGLLWWVRTTI